MYKKWKYKIDIRKTVNRRKTKILKIKILLLLSLMKKNLNEMALIKNK